MLRGEISEWEEIEPSVWARKGHPEDGIISLYNGMTFQAYWERRAEEPKRTIAKSVIVARLIAANKIADAKRALDANPAAFARWFASDRPAINHDDPDAIALLKAIGADPDVILAP